MLIYIQVKYAKAVLQIKSYFASHGTIIKPNEGKFRRIEYFVKIRAVGEVFQ